MAPRKKHTETPTMQLVSNLLGREFAQVDADKLRELYPEVFADGRIVTVHPGTDLKTFLSDARAKATANDQDSWDDVAFTLRVRTGFRAVRESVRTWANRYGIKELEHDYGVDPDAMPDGEPAAA